MSLNGSPSLLDIYVDLTQSMTAAYPDRKQRGRDLLLEQRSRAFPTTAMLMRGGPVEQRIKSGTRIESLVQLTLQGDFGLMNPGEDWTWGTSSGHEYLTSHWRKHRATESIDEDELESQIGGGVFDSDSVAMSLVNIERKKKASMWTKAMEVMEDYLWANPVGASDMESKNGRPRSLISAVNEYKTGHGSAEDGLPVGWTTQHGLDPTEYMSTDGTRSLLSCQQFGYDISASSSTAAGHLFDTLDEALSYTRFEAVPMAESFNEESSLMGAPGIFSSRKGKTLFNRTLRAHGEFFAAQGNRNDPAQRGVFDGMKVIDVPQLDNAAIYPKYTGSDDATQTPTAFGTGETGFVETDGDTSRGGRYWLFNPNYIKHYMKRGKDFFFRDWYALDQTNPEKYVCYIRLDDALHFESFQRHAMVYPTTDLSTY